MTFKSTVASTQHGWCRIIIVCLGHHPITPQPSHCNHHLSLLLYCGFLKVELRRKNNFIRNAYIMSFKKNKKDGVSLEKRKYG